MHVEGTENEFFQKLFETNIRQQRVLTKYYIYNNGRLSRQGLLLVFSLPSRVERRFRRKKLYHVLTRRGAVWFDEVSVSSMNMDEL